MMQTHASLKESLLRVADGLSADEVVEVLDFAQFMMAKRKREKQALVKRGSFKDLEPLIGILSIGGDAVVDSENYWE